MNDTTMNDTAIRLPIVTLDDANRALDEARKFFNNRLMELPEERSVTMKSAPEMKPLLPRALEAPPKVEKPAPANYRNQWQPTWTVPFGRHKGRTLDGIARDFGADELLPYRQRGVNQMAHNENEGQREINRTMVACIDKILVEYGRPIPHQTPIAPGVNRRGRNFNRR
jgi:hypothetical protein